MKDIIDPNYPKYGYIFDVWSDKWIPYQRPHFFSRLRRAFVSFWWELTKI
jgi:hypothetical protein